ncbi:MAG: hypothetical protein K0S37_783 [Microbacterium sp.]|jgi:hypothetical protein|nr:hypothetical protein [Microbacterium sp.]
MKTSHPSGFIIAAAGVIAGAAALVASVNANIPTTPAPVAGGTEATAGITVDPYAILAGFGETEISIAWTNAPAINCGAKIYGIGGCFNTVRPNEIVLSPQATGESLIYLTLHEYRHVQQHRAGQATDECDADRWAVEQGADPRFARYPRQGCEVTR